MSCALLLICHSCSLGSMFWVSDLGLSPSQEKDEFSFHSPSVQTPLGGKAWKQSASKCGTGLENDPRKWLCFKIHEASCSTRKTSLGFRSSLESEIGVVVVVTHLSLISSSSFPASRHNPEALLWWWALIHESWSRNFILLVTDWFSSGPLN
jgi:hypothetical protein